LQILEYGFGIANSEERGNRLPTRQSVYRDNRFRVLLRASLAFWSKGQDYTHERYLLMINDLFLSDQVDNIYAVFNGIKAGLDVYDFGGYNYGYGYNYSYMSKSDYNSSYYDSEAKESGSNWLKRLLSRFKV
jgi:hypothetical protein